MSGLRNFLVGAGQGAAFAASDLANKYIDDEILRNRQQAFLEMQRSSALQSRKDIDAFENDPTRRENLRAEAGRDAASAAESQLMAEKRRYGDAEYQAGRRSQLKADALVAGEAAAEQTIANGQNKAYLDAVKAVKLADPEVQSRLEAARAQIASSGAHTRLLNTQAEGAKLDLDDRKKLNGLFDRYEQVLNDKSLDDKTRGAKLGQLTEQLNVIRAKSGRSGSSNPEMDIVKVTDEEPLPSGGTRKTERTERRRPGTGNGQQPADDPIMQRLLANREAIKAKEQGGSNSPQRASAPAAAPRMETTRAADGSTKYRLQGQARWHNSEQEARRAEVERVRGEIQSQSDEPLNTYGAESSF